MVKIPGSNVGRLVEQFENLNKAKDKSADAQKPTDVSREKVSKLVEKFEKGIPSAPIDKAQPNQAELPPDGFVNEKKQLWEAKGDTKAATEGLNEPTTPPPTSTTSSVDPSEVPPPPTGIEDIVADLVAVDEPRFQDFSYEITRRPTDMNAKSVGFRVKVGDQSYDIKAPGPITEPDLERIAKNVAKTATLFADAGISTFKQATLNPSGDVDIDKPVFGSEGPLPEQLSEAIESKTIQGSLEGISLKADGSVELRGNKEKLPVDADHNKLRDAEFIRKSGDISNLATAIAKYVTKACNREEPTLVDGFLPGQVDHITDASQRSAEEKKSLAYTQLDSTIRNHAKTIQTDKDSPAFKEFTEQLANALGLSRGSNEELRAATLEEASKLARQLPTKASPWTDTEPSGPEEQRTKLEEAILRQTTSIDAKQTYMLLRAAELIDDTNMSDSLEHPLGATDDPGFNTLGDFVTQYEKFERGHLGNPAEDFWDKNWKLLQLREELEAIPQ